MAWLLGARLRGARDTVAQHATAGRSGAVPPARGSWLMSWLLGAAAARELLLPAVPQAAHRSHTQKLRMELTLFLSVLH
jgi:hypothetical protein